MNNCSGQEVGQVLRAFHSHKCLNITIILIFIQHQLLSFFNVDGGISLFPKTYFTKYTIESRILKYNQLVFNILSFYVCLLLYII